MRTLNPGDWVCAGGHFYSRDGWWYVHRYSAREWVLYMRFDGCPWTQHATRVGEFGRLADARNWAAEHQEGDHQESDQLRLFSRIAAAVEGGDR